MRRWFIYCFLFFFAVTACEEIYTPDIETRDSVIVVDARIVYGKNDNVIRISESRGFNDDNYYYLPVSGAKVSLIIMEDNEIELVESSDGVFPLNFSLSPQWEYKIKISYKGDTFESTYETVPPLPDLDTVYGVAENKVIKISGNNDVNDIREIPGVQLYTDISHEKEMPYYRFTARKVLQYSYPVEIPWGSEILVEPMYSWLSSYPRDLYNIAAPAEFSTNKNIVKHPLFFMEQKIIIRPDQSFYGWILILNQFGLSESAYNYYNDLNKQLGSEGRLFDPLYVQARNNLKCTSNPNQLILGNFEISSYKEHRFFINYISREQGYLIKPIPYFYEIPELGEQLSNPPDFWESRSKTYPNEK
ncbi:MAG TPA: DUF4249 domain-containing protein [Draconibacterium sp.]|nr:DUF4249 domain-containing protein [Draconibacterium sp.]